MKKLGKINLKNVSAFLYENDMKQIMGGWTQSGSGTKDDPFTLPEVCVTAYYKPKCPDNVFGCCKCPKWDADPCTGGDPYGQFGYRMGVALNHWINH